MSVPDSCDPAMLELFRAEMDAHVPVLSEGLLALEKDRAGDKDIESMMRAAHSIKGAARIVGIETAVRVAHVMEDCFLAAKAHRITLTSDRVDVLLQGVDALQRICTPAPASAMTDESVQALIDQITAVRDGTPLQPSDRPAQKSPVLEAPLQPTVSAARPADPHLVLPAVLDAPAAESLRVDLSQMLRNRPPRIRIDFGQVQHLSAAALSLFVSFAREIARSESPPAIDAEGVSVAMAELLRITGLDPALGRNA